MLVHAQGSNKEEEEEEEEEGGRGGGRRKEEEEEGGREGGGGRKDEAGKVSTNMSWVAYHTLCCYYKLGWNTGFKQTLCVTVHFDTDGSTYFLPVQLFPVSLTAKQRQVETLYLFCMVVTTQC